MSIRLFDIPSKLPQKAFSSFVWRTRYVLNYKGLPYKTTWVETPDLNAMHHQIGTITPTTRFNNPPWPL
ncbi:hypothetical protein L218DRAFT_956986, partial [Marasmius fiardii PR-910]